MIHRLFAALLGLGLLASVCFAQDKTVNDNAIYDNVRIKLAADAEVKGGALGVDVKEGVVTLSGAVDTDRQKSKAAKLAKKVKGVKRVINNITLKEKNAGK
jgi:hyperosmotically inducible periplasmic protein